jgi:hypothetical protein
VPKINMEVPHSPTAEEAKSRLERLAESMQGRFGDQVKDLSHAWADNALAFGFKTLGMRFDGTVGIEENKVVIDGNLPIAAMMFRNKIETEIRQQLERILRA